MASNQTNISSLERLVEDTASVIGLRICYHDRLGECGLPVRHCRHLHPACKVVRKDDPVPQCVAFDALAVHRKVEGKPEGQIHTCPYGLTEIAVPVYADSVFAGVLFAGPCWRGRGPSPHPELPVVKRLRWLEERRNLLAAVAVQFGQLIRIRRDVVSPETSRRERIVLFLKENQGRSVDIAELAKELSLSPSRTSHVVNSLFGISLPNLINTMKLEYSTYLLSASSMTIAEIANELGYTDQNYFSRLFARKYKIPPTVYRNRKKIVV